MVSTVKHRLQIDRGVGNTGDYYITGVFYAGEYFFWYRHDTVNGLEYLGEPLTKKEMTIITFRDTEL